ncbi:hypothetical protein M407DRAFT_12026 [Tulasnella calospora MUT 4182]|uniref:Uncharacterized protein n=1 Tax=Tulasnella calospora MUT 4182 TaxID=1051891 RepID=A0A0C3PTK6_9AGAM|nr:hypothetical protein M407DRAFT_12026 [Tulasnella calospora MUT 4182]
MPLFICTPDHHQLEGQMPRFSLYASSTMERDAPSSADNEQNTRTTRTGLAVERYRNKAKAVRGRAIMLLYHYPIRTYNFLATAVRDSLARQRQVHDGRSSATKANSPLA